MAGHGPPKTPTKILQNRGARVRGRDDEPSVPPEEPAMPDAVAAVPAARAVWEHNVPKLLEAGVLTQLDRDLLETYVRMHAQWLRAMDKVENEGDFRDVSDKFGNVKQERTDASRQVTELAETLNRMRKELGLTPASRAQLRVEGQAAGSGKLKPWELLPGGPPLADEPLLGSPPAAAAGGDGPKG
jgi:P27 family predicted phage terminase small subunit